MCNMYSSNYMNRADIIEKLYNIAHSFNFIINNDNVDFLVLNNVDSITFVEFVISIEDEFSIIISEEYMIAEKMNSISKIVNVVEFELLNNIKKV